MARNGLVNKLKVKEGVDAKDIAGSVTTVVITGAIAFVLLYLFGIVGLGGFISLTFKEAMIATLLVFISNTIGIMGYKELTK